MSEDLLNAIKEFDWSDNSPEKYRIHFDPERNGFITQIGADGQTYSEDPYIEVDATTGLDFLEHRKYKRSYHVVNKSLELKTVDESIYAASDNRLNQITRVENVNLGTYFITVKDDPDLVIDTIVVTEQNKDTEIERIKEYLENNDCYKKK